MVRAVAALLAMVLGGCATLAPPRPRFVTTYEQRTELCRIEVLQDTRSKACFVAFRCGRQPATVLQVDDDLCVP